MVDSRLPGMGLVGYFACTNSEVGARVLRSATEWLHKKYGLKDMYGPINGTLPNDYRLNLQDTFSFPGEPVNPLWYVDAFREAGFEVFNKYVSGITKHYKLLVKLTARKPKKGYRHLTTRAFDNEKHNQDFKIYHDLRNAIFPHMSIYCPAISLEERKYNSSGKFDPRYCYFLLDGSEPVGFIMAYIYKNQLIVKTIGLLEAYRGKNLSGQLVRIVHAQAGKEGIEAAIYGMVRVGNAVYKSRRPGVKLFRHYVTMHKSM